ncbi:MAG: hypothetical protein FJ221_04265 [Lentisphaerae bacterium]|nr:hypothetical protein [Lentisphaerota bacterium]
MKRCFHSFLAPVLLLAASCTTPQHQTPWRVEKTEIALYHSSTVDPQSGFILHIEYCAAKLSRGSDVLHVVYRPIDFPGRNPGFAEGDTVIVGGIDKAKDFGAVEGNDYWISDIKVAQSANKPDAGNGK